MRYKGKQQCKLSYKVFEEQDVYDPFIEISPIPIFIQLKYFIGGVKHCVTVVGNWVFDSNITFALPSPFSHID